MLITHPAVADVAVFGVPNEEMGEEVKAVVQPHDMTKAGKELEAELIVFCRKHLSPIKCPKSIDFEAELPRTPTGKLVKRHLRDKYWPKPAAKGSDYPPLEGRTVRMKCEPRWGDVFPHAMPVRDHPTPSRIRFAREPTLPAREGKTRIPFVMPGLVPGIHVFTVSFHKKTWMAGTSPAMTRNHHDHPSRHPAPLHHPLALRRRHQRPAHARAGSRLRNERPALRAAAARLSRARLSPGAR